MKTLVTGGAGYIGSHTVAQLLEMGEDVIVVDNLQKGHKAAVQGAKLLVGDLRDSEFLDGVFTQNNIESVIHFAADSLVGESVENPLKYYNNNVVSTLNLVTKMAEHNVDKIVFSSTAATYGEPQNIPILETDSTIPTNPYGETKLAVERALRWVSEANGIKYTVLRYFNAAGAHKNGLIGEDHSPETHLIPIVMKVALGLQAELGIFGDDYETPDGTCIRDYIHVTDLSDAHILALQKMKKDGKSGIYNLGNGKGFSVKEILSVSRKIIGREIKEKIVPRRAGDPAVLVASSEKAQKELGWKPVLNDIETIIESAWRWQSANPNGYGESN